MITRAEATAVTIVTFPAAAIVLAYLGDAAGLSLHAFWILALSLAATIAVAGAFARGEPFDSLAIDSDLRAFLAVTAVAAAWLLWLAWPHLLPIGRGSDLTHHLLLIDYIDRTGHLPHDRSLIPYFGEMFDYTPGTHLLAVLAGRWAGTDGLHALFPVIALSVALKAGFVFLIALRCVPASYRIPCALIAPLLLVLPSGYFLGSFLHDSFLAQVFAELFALAAWWAIVCWDQKPTAAAAAIFAGAVVATFLTWPVWIGPLIVTFVVAGALRRNMPMESRARQLAIALIPVAAIALLHAMGRVDSATTIAGASGFALVPTLAVVGWVFPLMTGGGVLVALTDRRARTLPFLLAAIVLQAAALVFVARASRAEAPYLSLKMFYLAIYPLAVAGAMGAAFVIRSAQASRSTSGATRRVDFGARVFSRATWAVLALLAIPAARVIVATPRTTPMMSAPLQDAGRWARANVPPACVDYLVKDDDTAYWLHLVVLGNSRGFARSASAETFKPEKALVRWILPGGLPYAIAEDVDTLPRDIRTNVDVLARFNGAAVIKRRGDSSCGGS